MHHCRPVYARQPWVRSVTTHSSHKLVTSCTGKTTSSSRSKHDVVIPPELKAEYPWVPDSYWAKVDIDVLKRFRNDKGIRVGAGARTLCAECLLRPVTGTLMSCLISVQCVALTDGWPQGPWDPLEPPDEAGDSDDEPTESGSENSSSDESGEGTDL